MTTARKTTSKTTTNSARKTHEVPQSGDQATSDGGKPTAQPRPDKAKEKATGRQSAKAPTGKTASKATGKASAVKKASAAKASASKASGAKAPAPKKVATPKKSSASDVPASESPKAPAVPMSKVKDSSPKTSPAKTASAQASAPQAAAAKTAATPAKAAPAPHSGSRSSASSAKKQEKTAASKNSRPSESRESMTAEEKARLVKFRETLAKLREDPEWPTFLEEQKEALLEMRDELVPNMQNVTRDHLRSGASNVSSTSGQHIGDAGSEAEVRDLTIRLLDKDREQIFEIDAALERIRRGTYGICEISLEPIPKGRLRVRPFCRLTVKCQEEYEKKYGSYANYKARNSDHVGFAGLQNDMESAISLDDSEE